VSDSAAIENETLGAEAHGDGGSHFSFEEVLAHHNHAFPAIEWLHHKPILVFNLAKYADKNLDYFSGKYVDQPISDDVQAWAAEYALAKGGVDEVALAQAMTAVDSQTAVMPRALSFFNQQTFWGTVALLIMAFVLLVPGRRGKDQVAPQGRLQHLIEGIVQFVRDGIVRPNIHHGDKWTAHFTCLFLAILSFNLMGLIPLTGTASGNPGVTAAFAVTTLVTMLLFGMKEQGVATFWKTLNPVPFSLKPIGFFVWALLMIIELMSLVIKPTALAIRLFANMFAGHTVLLAFTTLGFILNSAGSHGALSLGLGAGGFLLAVAICFLELLVALIQAYVFTLLSAVFVGASVHPEH
jgi:F-type H+-transporting ATPase subunit a